MGFVIFAGILAGIGYRVLEHLRITGEILPLLGLVCYMVIGLSVSALDAMSGVYIGLALLGGKYSGFCRASVTNLRRGTIVALDPSPKDHLREIKTVA